MADTLYKPVLTVRLPPGMETDEVTTDGIAVFDGLETRIHLPALGPQESVTVTITGTADGTASGADAATAEITGINILKNLSDEVEINLA